MKGDKLKPRGLPRDKWRAYLKAFPELEETPDVQRRQQAMRQVELIVSMIPGPGRPRTRGVIGFEHYAGSTFGRCASRGRLFRC